MVDETNKGREEPRGEARGGRGDGHEYRNRIFEHTQEAKEEAQMLASSLGELSQDLSSYLQEQVRTRPWAVLGVAAGVGYLLGGGIPSRITRAGMSMAARMSMGVLMRQLMEGQGLAFMGSGGGRVGESVGEGDTGV